MSDAMVQDRRPGDSEVRRRQRTKNLVVAGFLLALVVIFLILSIVHMGGQG
jgi:hypothetical protein